MKLRGKVIIAAILMLCCIIIHLYSSNEIRVENHYSSQFFPGLSRFLRQTLGGIPFSIGDFLYGILVGWIIWKFFIYLRKLTRKDINTRKSLFIFNIGINLLIFCTAMYILFNIFWGINYDRKGIAWQLGLKMEDYSSGDLKHMNGLLIEKLNDSKKGSLRIKKAYPGNKQLFAMVSDAYSNVSVKYPFLKYQPASLKSSMWGWLGNYTGFTGYYNPFTGEAQVNTSVPKFLQPFIACHEVAHQLGYAKEMEANFVGYLAASSSTDTLLRYSVYLDLFTYANRSLYFIDSAAALSFRKRMDPAVVADLAEWIAFSRKHRSFAEPIVRWIYGHYLKNNRQPQGILSYDEVTAFIIAYYKKYGRV